MKTYKNFTQIQHDLEKLNLERQIALEEVKVIKHNFEESLKPLSLLSTFAKFGAKYGSLLVLKKIFK
ncbi:hypothetical protein [uncultured Polaribacter sp.]|uniref:hypothetical protein n=1 Tax=uncultured Polaribacter sp. TaxID=174711 RepID=UPI002620A70A|nr:hypothetical protein [uncultured Polaribacter sp.]